MGLFLSAAEIWNDLIPISYCFIIGKKGKAREIVLHFRAIDFDHLSGIHYATDIDFKRHRKEYRGERLLSALKTEKIDSHQIEKSRRWPQIEKRLEAILHLKKILEADFELYEFYPERLPFHSQIHAKYLLFSQEFNDGVFLFLDEDTGIYYCKSAFQDDLHDYRENQSGWIVLKKIKRYGDKEEILFQHKNYKELHGQIMEERGASE